MNSLPKTPNSDFFNFMARAVHRSDIIWKYDILLKYTNKDEPQKIINMQLEAFDKIQEMPPNKKLIANAQLRAGSSPLVAYAIARFSTHIAAGITW